MTEAPEVHGTVRSVSGIVSSVLAALVAVLLIGDAVARGSWSVAMGFAPWVGLAVWVIWVGTGVSRVRLDDDGASVQNLLRRHRVPWGRVEDIFVRYQVVLETTAGRIACFGGPAAGRPGLTRRTDGDGPGTRVPPILRVRSQMLDIWSARKDAAGSQGPVTHSWDWPLIIVFGALLVWGLLQLALG